ncbi:MAG: hypothetical protein RLZZ350_1998 [Verrucomicrobiota bacterium]
MVEEQGVVDDDSPDEAGGGLEIGVLFVGESDDGEMARGVVLFELQNSRAHVALGGLQISADEERAGFESGRREESGGGDGLDAVAEVLEAVHQLGTGQEAFIKDKGKRLRHGAKLDSAGAFAKRFWRGLRLARVRNLPAFNSR